MNIHSRLTAKLAMALGLMAAIAATIGFYPAQAQNFGSQQRETVAQNKPNGAGFDGEGRGDRHRPRGPQFCEHGGDGERLEQMDGFLSANLDLTATQQEYWDTVLATFDTLDVAAICESEDWAALRAAGEQMREPMHTFMDSLSDEQRAEIRDFMQEQHERHRAEMDETSDN